jgi:hypothetical protein
LIIENVKSYAGSSGPGEVPVPDSGMDAPSEDVRPTAASTSHPLLRPLASLWFAGVVLVLLLVAMACATVYESMHGTERALAVFYRSGWFKLLLVLLGVNVSAALLVRWPFKRRQTGFVITHISILLILAGSLITMRVGVDGRVGLAEGQTTDQFATGIPTLTATQSASRAEASIDLNETLFTGFGVVDDPTAPPLVVGPLEVAVRRYLPDSTLAEHVIENEPGGRAAVEVTFAPPGGGTKPVIVFADETAALGPLTAVLKVVADEGELATVLAEESSGPQDPRGAVTIVHDGQTYEIPLSACEAEAVPIGETGTSVRLLRYLPHATVGADRKLTSASDRPVNPAIEVVLTGPGGPSVRRAFARFPDFDQVHGGGGEEAFKVNFTASLDGVSAAPVEVVAGPDERLHVRFQREGLETVTAELTAGESIDTPWPGLQFSVVRRLEGAVARRRIVPVEPVRETRIPALLVEMNAEGHTSEMWLQKYRPRLVTVDRDSYELSFRDKQVPLGFSVMLNRFTIGRYPGEMRPRSFESDITITDPTTGRAQSRIISMNRPVKHGGYTLYQSSYRQDGNRTMSFLSVSRDPGRIVVFAGYIALMIGMVVVLTTRAMRRGPSTVGDRLDKEGGR